MTLNLSYNAETACHFELSDTIGVVGGSLNSPNFNIDPYPEILPTTWNSNSDSGPTTTTDLSLAAATTTSIRASKDTTSNIPISSTATGVALPTKAIAHDVTITASSSPTSPSSASSPPSSAPQHSTKAPIIGTSIAATVGGITFLLSIILCTRARLGRESSRTERDSQQVCGNQGEDVVARHSDSLRFPELVGSNAGVELLAYAAEEEKDGVPISELI